MSNKNIENRPFPPVDSRFIWIGLGILSLLFNYFLSLNPYFTEVVYSRGFFLLIRGLFDFTTGFLPFPFLYLATPLLIGLIGLKWVKMGRRKQKKRLKNRVASRLLSIVSWMGGAVFFFYVLWGFNYQRVPLAEKLNLTVQRLDTSQIRSEFEWATQELLKARQAIPANFEEGIRQDQLPDQLESLMRVEVQKLLRSLEYPTPGRTRCKVLAPEGFLLRLGASGIYIPFVGEGHIDPALPAVSRPFTLAHELSHGLGFGEESSCNFLAFLACIQSENPLVVYSARFSYWLEIAQLYSINQPEVYQRFKAHLPDNIRADIESLRKVYEKYPGYFPNFSRVVYEWYLRYQGIEEGLENYSRVVELVYAWRK